MPVWPKMSPMLPCLFEELKPGQGLIETGISHQPPDGWMLNKGVIVQGKMVKKHGLPPFG